MSQRWLVATTNAGKLDEIRALLAGEPVDLLSLTDCPPVPEPEETGDTFAANARLKAIAYAAATGLPTLAEDSGLEVDALQGEPGVHSARYLGLDAMYAARFADIERRLSLTPDAPRTARFVCAVAAVQDGRVVFEASGVVEGLIARTPGGSGGFGYDPIFFYPPYGRTLAEVSQADKLAVAHRGQAFRALATWLRQVAPDIAVRR